jgi:hypothetical protein
MVTIPPEPIYPRVQDCRLGERIVGKIITREGEFEARSWPDYVLIGTYATTDNAVAAVSAAASKYVDPDKFSENQISVRASPESIDWASLFERLLDIIDDRRWREIIALQNYLQDLGICDDDAGLLMRAALKRYDDETQE